MKACPHQAYGYRLAPEASWESHSSLETPASSTTPLPTGLCHLLSPDFSIMGECVMPTALAKGQPPGVSPVIMAMTEWLQLLLVTHHVPT